MQKRFEFGSKLVRIDFGDGAASRLLKEELSLYRSANEHKNADIVVDMNQPGGLNGVRLQNPQSHSEISDGFQCKFAPSSVTWRPTDQALHVDFGFNESNRSLLRSFAPKWRSISYTSQVEEVGQVFHELVLIPALFFFSDQVTLIHGSAVERPGEGAIIFTGTGGVGKTSLELELILGHGYRFLADDICILTAGGSVHPNMAFPKIYAYNTLQDPLVRRRLLNGRSVIDKGQWAWKSRRSPTSVRRRVNPIHFFDGRVSRDSCRLSKLFVIVRSSVREPVLCSISAEEAVSMNIETLKAEYAVIFNHIYWHKFNSMVLKRPSLIDDVQIFEKWRRLQTKALHAVERFLLQVPVEWSALALKNWWRSQFLQNAS